MFFYCLLEQMQSIIPIMLLLKRKNIIFTQLKIGYTTKPLFSGYNQWIYANSFHTSLFFLSNKSTQAYDLYSGVAEFQPELWN
jgi:hypothetical protein